MKTLIKIDRNGTKHFADDTCLRCGGAGARNEWFFTGSICYECGGTGHSRTRTWKEYTPEYEAKLEARRLLKKAKEAGFETVEAWQSDIRAKEETERIEREREEERKRIEAEHEAERIRAMKAVSQFVGEEGQKLNLKATYQFSAFFDTRLGWMEQRIYIHNFRDENGNAIIWKTQRGLSLEEGQEVEITGTVKAHDVYKDEKQTALIRCKIQRAG